jgi:redox-sensitive bicupin YhaK (pirin superfamily)
LQASRGRLRESELGASPGANDVAGDSREVQSLHRGQLASDGAGVRLTRIIGTPALDTLDPFLLLDEFRSDDPQDYVAGFPDHPHRGFETVTYMLAGRMRHQDNQGNRGLLEAGSVQWMTAGRGIVHSELPEQEDGLLWGFQLWVNLPASEKLTDPRYQDISPERIPEVNLGPGAQARVVAGRLGDAVGPVSGAVATEPFYVDLRLRAGARAVLTLPREHTAFAYVYDGALIAGPAGAARQVERGQLARLTRGARLELAADGMGSRLLVVGGRPLAEPVARYGPFVMNTIQEIEQAIADYRAGRL